MFPTEPGLYWAKITEGPGRPKPDSFNAVVEVYGESPFFQIDALVFAEPRCAVRSVPPQLVSFGPPIAVPSTDLLGRSRLDRADCGDAA
jgi:hypothetical protein